MNAHAAIKFTPADVDNPNEEFAGALDVDSGRLIIASVNLDTTGARSGGHSAVVFARDPGTGAWRQDAELFPEPDAWTYGSAVAVHGETIAVADHPGGVVKILQHYTTEGAPPAWVTEATLSQTDYQYPNGAEFESNDEDDETAYFGYAVALSDDTALIGAPEWDEPDPADWNPIAEPEPDFGRAYIYERNAGGSWSLTATLAQDEAYGHFGKSVALEDGIAVVGSDHGVYIFERTATGSWIQTSQLLPTAVRATAVWFGSAVAISGDQILVGAPRSVVDGASSGTAGAAYLFSRYESSGSATAWLQTKEFALEVPADDYFGASVAMAPGTVLIGAPQQWNASPGAAYLYSWNSTEERWHSEKYERWDHEAKEHGDAFGFAVALSDGLAVVGAPTADLGRMHDVGAAYVWNVRAEPSAQSPAPSFLGIMVAWIFAAAVVGIFTRNHLW